MFTSALKSFTSNINGNYSIAGTPSSTSGPWKIYDAKKKSTGKAASVFVLDKKSLDHGGSLGRSSASSLKKAHEEVLERLKKEASSLARLRHPNILELVEPVEETRSGGLQFATEPVTASLSGLLLEKDEQERAGGVGGRSSRYVTEDPEGGKRRREVEIDELEIQKGLEQVSKALEFLHDNAGLVHGNLTPDAIFVNAKSDWKISGLSFSSPPDGSTKPSSVIPINLSEVLNIDPRLPRSVQMNLDYCSPDFVLDSNLNISADMFSLGLLIIALYNSPHTSPLQTNASVSTYKRLFTSSSTIPSAGNDFLCTRPLPKELKNLVLPRLITRRPAQRMTAKEFQQSAYFDNILISTIRFLDSLPGKTPTEKAQFMRGLPRVLPSFPKSVLDKKVLPALLEEMKDRDLLAVILKNIFTLIELLPSGRRPFTEKIIPRLREIFLPPAGAPAKAPGERDPAKEAGLVVLLEHLRQITSNCSGKEFKDDILPIIHLAIESPTHGIVDASLRSLPIILPILDFSTIKNELFPVIASVFSKTNSLGIKVRGLEAFVILCGGSNDPSVDDGLDGVVDSKKKTSSSTALDKYTMQEKIVPLIRAIKTKEPAVAMAALNVLRQISGVADAEFVAMDVLPILWSMSLGPLLDLKQFQSFMELIRTVSSRVEAEQTRKLTEISGINGSKAKGNDDFMSFGGTNAFGTTTNDDSEIDFESLVKGVPSSTSTNPLDSTSGWDASPSLSNPPSSSHSQQSSKPAAFAWSTPSPTTSARPQQVMRTITPDLSRFDALTPSSTQFSQPLQPASPFAQSSSSFGQPTSGFGQQTQNGGGVVGGFTVYNSARSQQAQQSGSGFSIPPLAPSQSQTSQNAWASSSTPAAVSNPWATSSAPQASLASLGNSMNNLSMGNNRAMSTQNYGLQNQNMRPAVSAGNSFSLPPPPGAGMGGNAFNSGGFGGFQSPPPAAAPAPAPVPGFGGMGMGMGMGGQQQAQPKKGLDAWESLL